MKQENVPLFVSHVTQKLLDNGFEAYLVGGCVRDLLIDPNSKPKDWDLTTNAHPEQVQEVFKELRTVYENNFGTVTVLNKPSDTENANEEALDRTAGQLAYEQVQITTYRSETSYNDSRHPDSVSYETDILKDLERRDFTMNAIAWNPIKGDIIDPFNGQKDIKDKTIHCVLDSTVRFQEDALRMLRAVRFATTLNFNVSHETLTAITNNSRLLSNISSERIRDEFLKIINSANPAFGVELLQKTGLLEQFIPELLTGIGCDQKGAHIYDVYHHLLHALQHAADKNLSETIRLTALFHDIGKPATRRYDAKKDKYTFFGHEVVGARMTKTILERLKVPRETSNLVTNLVRNHMFFSDTEQITLSAVRRIIQKVQPEHIWELMQVRECDRVGMKKAEAPYRLRKYHAMIEEALRDPISVSQLAIDGTYLMSVLHMKPGPRMGWILHALLQEVLEDPTLNTVEILTDKVSQLDTLSDGELKQKGMEAKETKDQLEQAEVKALHVKHKVSK